MTPASLQSPVGRNPVGSAAGREGRHVDLETACWLGGVGDPAAIWRELSADFRKGRLEQTKPPRRVREGKRPDMRRPDVSDAAEDVSPVGRPARRFDPILQSIDDLLLAGAVDRHRFESEVILCGEEDFGAVRRPERRDDDLRVRRQARPDSPVELVHPDVVVRVSEDDRGPAAIRR